MVHYALNGSLTIHLTIIPCEVFLCAQECWAVANLIWPFKAICPHKYYETMMAKMAFSLAHDRVPGVSTFTYILN